MNTRIGIAVLLLSAAPMLAEERSASPRSLAGLLEARIQGKGALSDVRVDAYYAAGGASSTARVYGDGVGIWDRSAQFALSRDEVLAILRILEKADFAHMRSSTGSVPAPGDHRAPRLTARLALQIGATSKEVVQYLESPVSPELRDTVQAVLNVCRKPASRGVRAPNLREGLRMVADERLAPETVAVVVQQGPGPSDAGWTLHLDGRVATARAKTSGTMPPAPRRLTLSEAEFRDLAGTLAESGFESLPVNLYAPDYRDLRIAVLDRSHDVAGRKFGNMTAQTHGAKQEAFDRVYAAMAGLAARALKDGEDFVETRVAEPKKDIGKKAAAPASPTPVRRTSPARP